MKPNVVNQDDPRVRRAVAKSTAAGIPSTFIMVLISLAMKMGPQLLELLKGIIDELNAPKEEESGDQGGDTSRRDERRERRRERFVDNGAMIVTDDDVAVAEEDDDEETDASRPR